MKKASYKTLNTLHFLKTTAMFGLLLSGGFSDSYASRTTTTDDSSQGKAPTTGWRTPDVSLANQIASPQTFFDIFPSDIISHIANMSCNVPQKDPAHAIKSFLGLCIVSPLWAGEKSRATANRLLAQSEDSQEKLETYACEIIKILKAMEKKAFWTKAEIVRFLAILEASLALFTEKMDERERYWTIKAFLRLTPEQIEERSQAITATPILFTKLMSGEYRANIIAFCLKNLTPGKIKAIAAAAPALFTEKMNEWERYRTILACDTLTPEQIKAIAAAAPALFTEKMDGENRAWVIEMCRNLKPEQIKAIAVAAPALFAEKINTADRVKLILACLTLTPEQIEERSQAITATPILFTKVMSGEYRANIIAFCLKNLTPGKIKAIAAAAPALFTKKMEEWECYRIIKACDTLTPEQIKAIAVAAPALFAEKINTADRVKLILACLTLTPEEIAQKATFRKQ